MKATDFMIGNWVLWIRKEYDLENEIVNIFNIQGSTIRCNTNIDGLEQILLHYENIQPIPVTHQNIIELLKLKVNVDFLFKATKYKSVGALNFIANEDENDNLLSLTFSVWEQATDGEVIITRIKECKYIHEVQNIINTCK